MELLTIPSLTHIVLPFLQDMLTTYNIAYITFSPFRLYGVKTFTDQIVTRSLVRETVPSTVVNGNCLKNILVLGYVGERPNRNHSTVVGVRI